jgi:PDZ domain-containing protein
VKRLLIAIVAIAAVVAFLAFTPSDHYLFIPDRARPVDPLVKVAGEKPDPADPNGDGVYMVDILIRKASLLERMFPSLASGSTLVPGKALNPEGVSDAQRAEEGKNQMSRSQEIAAAVALKSLGYKIKITGSGARVDSVVPGRPANGVLKPGDTIVEANGESVKTGAGLVKAMASVDPGDEVELVTLRGGKRMTVTVETAAAADDPKHAVVGIAVSDAATFELPVDISIDVGDIGGPSAGLPFALDIVDELGDDVDDGRRVVATGELALDGTVFPIGGVKQKTIGAKEAGADIFLVPDDNAAEARKYADGLKIVPVSNFREALAALAS